MPTSLRFARRLMVFGLAIYWPAIALGTHLPNQPIGVQWVNDKALHACAFFGLSVLLSWCFMARQPTFGRTVVVLSIALLYGVVDEITQVWVPTRSADLFDWFADTCGAVVGLAFYYASQRTVSWVLCQRDTSWSSTLPIELDAGIVVPETGHIPERAWQNDAA